MTDPVQRPAWEHKVEQTPEARVQCNQCMWVGVEDDLLWIGEDYIRHCPACNANDETLMDLTTRDAADMHHEPAPEEKKATLFAHDCTDGMSRIYVNNESFDYIATVKGQREAARIVSCVAACMGMPDELLTPEAFIETSAKLTEVATERDALLAALEDLISVASRCDGWESFPSSALERAQDVIASCKGGDV